jgi:hypothetical protein
MQNREGTHQMRLAPMALGLMAWTAAIAVPALYGALIALAAGVSRHAPYESFTTEQLMPAIHHVPFAIWLYSLATAQMGALQLLWTFRKDEGPGEQTTI